METTKTISLDSSNLLILFTLILAICQRRRVIIILIIEQERNKLITPITSDNDPVIIDAIGIIADEIAQSKEDNLHILSEGTFSCIIVK